MFLPWASGWLSDGQGCVGILFKKRTQRSIHVALMSLRALPTDCSSQKLALLREMNRLQEQQTKTSAEEPSILIGWRT